MWGELRDAARGVFGQICAVRERFEELSLELTQLLAAAGVKPEGAAAPMVKQLHL